MRYGLQRLCVSAGACVSSNTMACGFARQRWRESQAELTHRVDTRGQEKGQSKHTSNPITSHDARLQCRADGAKRVLTAADRNDVSDPAAHQQIFYLLWPVYRRTQSCCDCLHGSGCTVMEMFILTWSFYYVTISIATTPTQDK